MNEIMQKIAEEAFKDELQKIALSNKTMNSVLSDKKIYQEYLKNRKLNEKKYSISGGVIGAGVGTATGVGLGFLKSTIKRKKWSSPVLTGGLALLGTLNGVAIGKLHGNQKSYKDISEKYPFIKRINTQEETGKICSFSLALTLLHNLI